jgi:hypothetical protein
MAYQLAPLRNLGSEQEFWQKSFSRSLLDLRTNKHGERGPTLELLELDR